MNKGSISANNTPANGTAASIDKNDLDLE